MAANVGESGAYDNVSEYIRDLIRQDKERVERVVAAGLMTEAGMSKIRAAKQDGSWALLDEIDALIVPDDLAAALDDAGATEAFDSFTPSQKKPLLYWISSAKRPATRAKRIAETVRRALAGAPPGAD